MVTVTTTPMVGRCTRLIDVNLKRARYAAACCPAYWALDPGTLTLTAWSWEARSTSRPRESDT